MTQVTVAQLADISDQWYRCIERRGRQPSLPVVQAIAAAIGCEIADFCFPVTSQVAA